MPILIYQRLVNLFPEQQCSSVLRTRDVSLIQLAENSAYTDEVGSHFCRLALR